MKIKFSKLMLVYFVSVLTITLGIIGYGSYYSWSNGISDFNKISSVYKANVHFDEISKGDQLKSIKAEVTSDGIRKALKKMEALHKKVEKVNLIFETDTFDDLADNLKVAKTEMLKLISFPEVSSIVGVLNRKISGFHNYVTDNNWKTLTRMSKRLKVVTSPASQASPHFFRYRKLKSTYKFIKNYQKKMRDVTNGSILSPENKEVINKKLDALNTELKMLGGFLKSYSTLNMSISNFEKSFKVWVTETRPGLAGMRLSVETSSKYFYMAIAIFAALLFLTIIAGFKINEKANLFNKKQIEETTLRLVRDGMIPFQSKIDVMGSEIFKDELGRYKDYFHKRMSFGAIFQEAVPFPAILLDSNLNLVWANKLFYEEWKVGNISDSENQVTWDYLQKFTNLGEDDPVFSAINQGLAGIYQIQLKLEDSDESTPYEMYVTPVSYLEQKRVMIFFYPLGSLEDTLNKQRKSMIGPVMKSLDAFISNGFEGKFIEDVESDFEAAGIGQVYKKFLDYDSKYNNDRDVFINEIEMLNANLEKSEDAFNKISKKVESIVEDHSTQKDSFESFKNLLISNVEVKHNLQERFNSILSNISEIMNVKNGIVKDVNVLNSVFIENRKVLDAINTDKEKIKKFKSELEDLKFSLRKKCSTLDRTHGHNLMKDIFPEVDITLDKFVKTLNHLDITMSKANMIMDQGREVDLTNFLSVIGNVETSHFDNTETVNSLFQNMQSKEDGMISSLKQSFESYKNIKGDVGEMGDILTTQLIPGVIENNETVTEVRN